MSLLLLGAGSSGAAWTPDKGTSEGAATPFAWWDADDITTLFTDAGSTNVSADGDAVYEWHDKTAAKLLRQTTEAARPHYKTNRNGTRPAVFFDDDTTAEWLTSTLTATNWKFLHTTAGHSVFIVFRTTEANPDTTQVLLDTGGSWSSTTHGFGVRTDDRSASSNESRLVHNLYRGSSGNPTIAITSTHNACLNNTWHVLCIKGAASGTNDLWQDGRGGTSSDNLTHTNAASSSDPTGTLHVGIVYDETNAPLTGDIAEIVIYNTMLSDNDARQVVEYLRKKWSIPYYLNRFDPPNAVSVTNDSSHNAFVSLAEASNGTLIMSYRKATDHVTTPDGEWKQKRSTDTGATWGSEETVIADDATYCFDNGVMTLLADGSLIAAYTRRIKAVASPFLSYDSVFARNSTDNGANWSALSQVTGIFTLYDILAGHIVELTGGRLILPLYGKDTGDTYWSTRLVYSDDDGATWSLLGMPGDGQTDSLNYTECSVIEDDSASNLIAIIRLSTTGLYRATSSNGGATWTTPSLVISGMNGMPAVSKVGALYVGLFRDQQTGQDARARLMVSTDKGATWQVGSSMGTSGGSQMVYGNLVNLSNGDWVIGYAHEVAANNADVYFIPDL